jgi:hypothetical protein
MVQKIEISQKQTNMKRFSMGIWHCGFCIETVAGVAGHITPLPPSGTEGIEKPTAVPPLESSLLCNKWFNLCKKEWC